MSELEVGMWMESIYLSPSIPIMMLGNVKKKLICDRAYSNSVK